MITICLEMKLNPSAKEKVSFIPPLARNILIINNILWQLHVTSVNFNKKCFHSNYFPEGFSEANWKVRKHRCLENPINVSWIFFFFFFAREKAYTYQNHKYLGAPEIPWNFKNCHLNWGTRDFVSLSISISIFIYLSLFLGIIYVIYIHTA